MMRRGQLPLFSYRVETPHGTMSGTAATVLIAIGRPYSSRNCSKLEGLSFTYKQCSLAGCNFDT